MVEAFGTGQGLPLDVGNPAAVNYREDTLERRWGKRLDPDAMNNNPTVLATGESLLRGKRVDSAEALKAGTCNPLLLFKSTDEVGSLRVTMDARSGWPAGALNTRGQIP